jgi:hypothetical protein
MESLLYALDTVMVLLATGALGMAATPFEVRAKAARLMFLLAAGFLAIRWIMWTFETDSPWWIRAVIGAVVGGFLLAALPAAWIWTKNWVQPNGGSDNKSHVENKTNETKRPTFEATNRSEILTRGAAISGTVPYPLARADRDSKVDMSGMLWIGPDAPTQFPAPTGEFSKLSNAELRRQVREIVVELRSFQARFNAESPELDPRHLTIEQIKAGAARQNMAFSRFADEYQLKFPAIVLSLASELLKRTNGLDDDSTSQDARIGAQLILSRRFAGGQPAARVAEFLDAVAAKLPD